MLRKYLPEDFELLRKIGTMTVKELFEVRDSVFNNPTVVDASLGGRYVNLYAGRFYEGPLSKPQPVLLREYPGDAQALARTELRIYERLLGTLRAEGAPPAFALTLSDKNTGGGEPALAPLLGCFDSVSVAAADQLDAGKELGEDAVWLVQRWEVPLVLAGAPAAVFKAPPPAPPPTGLAARLLRRAPDEAAVAAHGDMLRRRMAAQVMKGSMAALAFCHSRSVVHRALSGSALLLSTYKLDAAAEAQAGVRVRLTNFGSAADVSEGPDSLGATFVDAALDAGARTSLDITTLARAQDTHALGLALAEFVFGLLAASGPSDRTTVRALDRVFEGLFELDVEAIRDFYAAEEQFEAVVAFLDRTDRGGWTVLHALLSRSIPVDVILQTATPFLADLVDSPSR